MPGFFDPLPQPDRGWSSDQLRIWLNGQTFDPSKIRPSMQSWTPSYTNLTVGSSTVVARYRNIGGWVEGWYEITLGAGSSFGSDPSISLPVQASASYTAVRNMVGQAYYLDNTTQHYMGAVYLASATTFKFLVHNAASTLLLGGSGPSSTSPMTWTTGDMLTFRFAYEAA